MSLFKLTAPKPGARHDARKRMDAYRIRLGFLDSLLATLLWLLALVFMAALVHLVSIFALPQLSQKKDAYSRISRLANPGMLTLLPQAKPGDEIAPFSDPALVQAVCLFDLDRGPLEFSAETPKDGLLTFSFRTRTGRVFYSMTDRAAAHGQIDVVVMTQKQLEAAQADDDEDDPPQELRLTSPEKRGFLLINALAAYPSERPAIEALLKSMSCNIDDAAGNAEPAK